MNNNNQTTKFDKRAFAVIAIVIIGCAVMAVTDAVIQPGYASKSAVKAVFFLALPFLYASIDKQTDLKSLFELNKRGVLSALLLGAAVYAVIIAAYLICRNFYDFGSITSLLTQSVGVSKANFTFVAVYISFCNSLLEEFFFRGFAFIVLSRLIGNKSAYFFSAFAFAVYHVAIMSGWFSVPLFILAMLGLAVGACIFNSLDAKNQTIYNSWMVHMFANFAINTVGLILFGIL